ncbi:hypothetical protein [Campylobacter mucosalis]|nr:hypothetical protein [Campylobacter mucosalis]
MQIIYTQNFQNRFFDLLAYIAKHSLQNAVNFEAEIEKDEYDYNAILKD